MFYHVKELQFNARVSKADPRFARLLLEQFGGGNGELKAAMQYFTQAYAFKQSYPDKYDLLMDIATEEFSHLEIVGATIQMLLKGINGELKDCADAEDINTLLDGKEKKEAYIHEAMINPQFYVLSGGGPTVTDSNGNPWRGDFVNANGDLTVDLRSNMGAESRAKIVYEQLLQFTDDPYVKETLRFLMTREVAHFQMFEAALGTIKPNFPMGILQSDPKHSNTYFNMSEGLKASGPWNEGKSTQLKEDWMVVEDPVQFIMDTNGLTEMEPEGTKRTERSVQTNNRRMAELRSTEVKSATPEGECQWSDYPEPETAEEKAVAAREEAAAAKKPAAKKPLKKKKK
jgi:Mn-containing catalase